MYGSIKMNDFGFSDVLICLDKVKYLEDIDTEFKKIFNQSIFNVFKNYLTETEINEVTKLLLFNRIPFYKRYYIKIKYLMSLVVSEFNKQNNNL